MGLSIVMPCYNEASRGDFKSRLKNLITYMSDSGVDYEIICVDDGSKDETAEVIRGFKDKVILVSCGVNRGKGYALKSGFRQAKMEYILMMDADLSVPLEFIGVFYRERATGVCICGSRRVDSAVVEHDQTFFRKCLGFCSRCCTRFLLGIPLKDTQCGFKLFERSRVMQVLPYIMSDRWLFDIELLMYLQAEGVVLNEYGVRWGTQLNSILVCGEALYSSSKELIKILREGRKNVKEIKKLV